MHGNFSCSSECPIGRDSRFLKQGAIMCIRLDMFSIVVIVDYALLAEYKIKT